MRLAYFSPLPPSKSGIADYSAELLPHLARGADITVFVERPDEMRANQGNAHFQVELADSYARLQQAQPYDLCIYHQGNNPYHEYIYDRAVQTPGLVVLHEHCLHHLLAWKTLGRKDEAAFWDELFYAYGRRGARVAIARENDAASEYQQFLMPANRRLLSQSRGVIVHNHFAAAQLELPAADLPVAIIPHHLSPHVYALDELDARECRRALGLPEDALIIASFGYVTQSKRVPTLLHAFKRLTEIVPNAYCLIAGEDHWKWSVAPIIEELGLQKQAHITGYTSEHDFFRYLKAVDVVVNLRYPTAGETSGTLIRSLGAGKAVVVSDYGQFGELPDDVCLKVTPGKQEERELLNQLRALASRPHLREQLGQQAKTWMREQHEVRRCAARYLQFIESVIAAPPAETKPGKRLANRLDFKTLPTIALDHAEALEYVAQFYAADPHASGYIRFHRQRLLRTVELIPQGDGTGRLLDLSSYLQMPLLARRYGQYAEIAVTNWWHGDPQLKVQTVSHAVTGETVSLPMHNVNVETDRLPFPDEHFDVVLCCELIEHLREDPMHMLAELNRVVKWGGLVIITTPNLTSAFSVQEAMAGRTPNIYNLYNRTAPYDRHSREYTPAEVSSVLEAAGFKVTELFTENAWHETDESYLDWLDKLTTVPRSMRGDNIYAVGRKQSYVIDRYPETIYE